MSDGPRDSRMWLSPPPTRRRRRKWRAVVALTPPVALAVALLSSSGPPLVEQRPVQHLGNPGELDVNGQLPERMQPSPKLLRQAPHPRQLARNLSPRVDLPDGPLGIPGPMLAAYVGGAGSVDMANPGCHLPWSVLASIGRIESGHARDGQVDVQGTTTSAILGPRLSGSAGAAAIPDSDGGQYDGDPVWDRAVGPMQFIPSTWNRYAVDGNGDGVASPHNVHDAAVAAGNYLCSAGGDLRDPRDLAAAVFSYNHSDSYVRTVLVWADAYERGVTPTPAELAPKVSEDEVLAGQRLPEGPSVVALPPPLVPGTIPPPPMPAPGSGAPPPPSSSGPGESSSSSVPSQSQSPSSSEPSTSPTTPSTPGSSESSTPDPTSGSSSSEPAPSLPLPTGSLPLPTSTSSSSPPPSSSTPPATTPPPPSTPPLLPCALGSLLTGEFVTTPPPSPTDLAPGTTDPRAAVPGQVVYVESLTGGLLQPCVVPEP